MVLAQPRKYPVSILGQKPIERPVENCDNSAENSNSFKNEKHDFSEY